MSKIAMKCNQHSTSLWLLFFFFWLLLIVFQYSSIIKDKFSSTPAKSIPYPKHKDSNKINAYHDQCSGRYIYIHNLPRKFNADILQKCSSLIKWSDVDMCSAVSNMGLGPKEINADGIFPNKSWFATHQFLLEPIFHSRMKRYKCLTSTSSKASAIYVPYYPGLDVGRYLWDFNSSLKDSTSISLFDWLIKEPEWNFMSGKDHFFVLGRTTWDFRRQTDNDSDWGNRLMLLPNVQNVTILSIESHDSVKKDFAIPYPTYFHPSNNDEVFEWQDKVRKIKRKYLYSFIGAPRPQIKNSVRNEIIVQCKASGEKCKWIDCSSSSGKCNSPSEIMKTFQNSVFCLQPRGDSYTRRSAFDAIAAGCIPVFFNPLTAYKQYKWHLPKNYTTYSVFIPDAKVQNGEADIETTLERISNEVVMNMREEVIKLIPKVIYAHPSGKLDMVEDAFDIAVKGVLDRVKMAKKEIDNSKKQKLSIKGLLSI